MRRRSIGALIIGFALSVVLGGMPTASAHILQSDGEIGAVFHIDPDDSAVSGRLTTYELFFSDTSDRLDLADCDCTATLSEQNRKIMSAPLHAIDARSSEDTITFPRPAVYTLTIAGKPRQGAEFQAFSTAFEVRANDDTGASALTGAPNEFPTLLVVGIGLSVSLLLLAAVAREYTKDITKKRSPKS